MVEVMKIEYHLIQKQEFNDIHRQIFAEMLKRQGKVQGDLMSKVDRCKMICIARVNDNPAAIGAIKQKTNSDFTAEKADVPELAKEFDWELGYLYTDKEYSGRGIASVISKTLIDNFGKENLMASTEISANPATVRILEKNGFRLFGKPWKSKIHDNFLGLYLRFK
jgi:GNAT superfamily N-acetyltransferase